MSLEIVMLSSSAAAIADKLVPLLKRYLQARVEQHLPPDAAIESVHAPSELQIRTKGLEGLTQERLQQIEEGLKAQGQLAGAARQGILRPDPLDALESAKDFGAFVLAISPQAVFSDARKRIGLVFKLNLGVSILLATILLGGIGGAVFSALFFKSAIWALVFGGISATDVIGVYAFKPLSAINDALDGTTRLDTLQLRLSEQLSQCAQYPNLED